MNSFNPFTSRPLYKGTKIIVYVLSFVEILLSLRFILRFVGVNAEAYFTNIFYAITQIFVSPFTNTFSANYSLSNAFEWTTLLAMLVYWIVATGIINLFVIEEENISMPRITVKFSHQD